MQKTILTFAVWKLVWLLGSPVLQGQNPVLRQPIPTEGGSAAVERYVLVAGKLGTDYLLNWAEFHKGFVVHIDTSGSDPTAKCLHYRAEFLIWHHAYLVLTEELFGIADGSPFAMPYWSPAEGSKVPAIFWSHPGLADDKRFPGHPVFESAHNAYKNLLSNAGRSFFCETSVQPVGGRPRDRASGDIERLIHDPVHDESIKSHGRLAVRDTAAQDLFFHPFHAGIDKIFLEYLDTTTNKCEICAGDIKFPSYPNDSQLLWLTQDLGELPEPQCLISTASGVKLNTAPGATYATLTGMGNCSGLRNRNGIPHRKFLVDEVLKAPRFWMRGYARQDGTSIAEKVACNGQPECSNQQTVACPLKPTTIELALPEGVFVPLAANNVEPPDLGTSSFKISVSGLKLDPKTVGAIEIVFRRNRWFSRSLTVGTVRYSGWRASLLAGHEGHMSEGPAEEYLLYPTDDVNGKLARLLKPGGKKSVQVSFKPIGGTTKSLNTSNSRIMVKGFPRQTSPTTP